jgi:hypothetical protein
LAVLCAVTRIAAVREASVITKATSRIILERMFTPIFPGTNLRRILSYSADKLLGEVDGFVSMLRNSKTGLKTWD